MASQRQQLALQSFGCLPSAQATIPLHTSHIQHLGSNNTLIAALAARLGTTERILGLQNSTTSHAASAMSFASSMLNGSSSNSSSSSSSYLGNSAPKR
eukprot:44323-Ditylum_brightwellii.AAC.1